MPGPSKIRNGFLIIADISGYTSFVSGTEFEHAQEIMEEITALLISHIQSPFKLVKLEGDATFYYAPAESLPDTQRLLDHIEGCYYDFATHLKHMQLVTHCHCKACSSIHDLDLKFFVHFGEYMVQRVPGTADDLAGPDVILLHRLTKNMVEENYGLRGYALFTDPAMQRIGKLSLTQTHKENYEHLGDVECKIYNLQEYEHRMRQTHRVYLERHESDYIFDRTVKTTPEILWSYIVEPQKRIRWQALTVENKLNDEGRLGVDAEFHCDHGEFTRNTKLVDWRPFHYMTSIALQSFRKIPWKGPPCQTIYEFVRADDNHTRFSLRVKCLKRDWFNMLIVRLVMKRMLDKENNADFKRLEKELERIKTVGET